LIGSHLTGQGLARNLKKEDLLIVDFDPEIIEHLKENGFAYIFGDISDPEIFERANVNKARLVISTSPDFETNLSLLASLKGLAGGPKVIVRAETERDAEILYENGADYAFLPQFTSGHYIARVINSDPELKTLPLIKERDLNLIKKENI
jgi:Trk K+ transport system NAD-binding subunit